MRSFSSGCVALLVAQVAHAAPPERELMLQDGARTRAFTRLQASSHGLRALTWRDAVSARTARAWVGRRAIVEADDPAALARSGVRVVRALMPERKLWLVESATPSEDGLALSARLQAAPGFGAAVRQAFPDLYLARTRTELAIPPDDPRYPGQWFYARLGLEEAWAIEAGRPEVSIVVIDNGCDLQHPDLRDKMDPGRDVLDDDDDPSPVPNVSGNSHGTACAGLVAASTNNGLGVAGTCPGCRVRCVRLLSDDGRGLVPVSADVAAFQFVLDVNADVASNSWGFVDAIPVPQPLADAIQTVREKGRSGRGALVVFAAGNDNRELGDDELNAVPGVVTVGAVNNFGEVTQFSNSGASVDVVAPTGTLTTDVSGADGDDPGDYLASFGGTSSACPLVAGIFGLLVSAAPERTAAELEEVLRMTAEQSPFATPDSRGHDLFYGWGLVRPAAALRVLKPPASEEPASGCAQGGGGRTSPLGLLLVLALVVFRRRRLVSGA